MSGETCRVCHGWERRPFVRFATRHNAHWDCKMAALKTDDARKAFIEKLPAYEIKRAPFMLLQDIGLLNFVRELTERRTT